MGYTHSQPGTIVGLYGMLAPYLCNLVNLSINAFVFTLP